MLHCVPRLQRLGIQLLFVFGGPKRPPKHGRRAPRTQGSETRLWRETLWNIGTPFYDALGEAEAECARLEQLGLVDAVWSKDGDVFIFGAKTLIRFYYEERGKKDGGDKASSNGRKRKGC